MKTLDRSRPFAVIFPHHEGAAFEQDGIQYDAEGNQVGANPVPANFQKRGPGRPRKEEPALATAEAPVNPQLAAQLADD
ncbi:MAG: hypothetical protein WC322_03860 [Candidatus Paceibacterota bacterium]